MQANFKKIVQMINFFACKAHAGISKLHVLKLVFLADRYHMRKYGTMISNDEYWAMKYGPVPSYTKDVSEMLIQSEQKTYAERYLCIPKNNRIQSVLQVDLDELGKTEQEALEYAFSVFMTEVDIVEVTHKLPEWKKHESQLNSGASRIKMNPLDFFETAPGKSYSGDMPAAHVKLAKEIFMEDAEIRRLLE